MTFGKSYINPIVQIEKKYFTIWEFNSQKIQQILIKFSCFSSKFFANYFVLNIDPRYGSLFLTFTIVSPQLTV
jgi:hypothetical protein